MKFCFFYLTSSQLLKSIRGISAHRFLGFVSPTISIDRNWMASMASPLSHTTPARLALRISSNWSAWYLILILRILIDILDYTGSETDGCVVRLVPETVADFGSQELIGNNATAYRAENSVVFRRRNFRQNSDVEINVPNIPSISKWWIRNRIKKVDLRITRITGKSLWWRRKKSAAFLSPNRSNLWQERDCTAGAIGDREPVRDRVLFVHLGRTSRNRSSISHVGTSD